MGYRLTKAENDTKQERETAKKKQEDDVQIRRAYDSGSVTSSIDGGGMKPCEAATSIRGAFAACDSLMLPCCGERLVEVAIGEGIVDCCPLSVFV